MVWEGSAPEGYQLYSHQPMATRTARDEVPLGKWPVPSCLLHVPYWEADAVENLRGSAAILEQLEPWREMPSLHGKGNQAVDMTDTHSAAEGSMAAAGCGSLED
jgi:hypothetical protein